MNALHITYKHRGKMSGMVSINTSPIGNKYCKTHSKIKGAICEKCYAIKQCSYQPFVEKRFRANGLILSKSHLDPIPQINATYCRLHAFGELCNNRHLANFVRIVEQNPRTTFSLWTKRKDLINRYNGVFPKNLILIYSALAVNPIKYTKPPRGFHKIFCVYTKSYADQHNIKINCGARHCFSCLKCYTKSNDTVIREYVK